MAGSVNAAVEVLKTHNSSSLFAS